MANPFLRVALFTLSINFQSQIFGLMSKKVNALENRSFVGRLAVSVIEPSFGRDINNNIKETIHKVESSYYSAFRVFVSLLSCVRLQLVYTFVHQSACVSPHILFVPTEKGMSMEHRLILSQCAPAHCTVPVIPVVELKDKIRLAKRAVLSPMRCFELIRLIELIVKDFCFSVQS